MNSELAESSDDSCSSSSDSSSSSSDDDDDNNNKKESEEHILALKPGHISKFGRSRMFDPTQAHMWSKKSIAIQFGDMLRDLQDMKIDYDAAGGAPSDIDFMSDSADNINGNKAPHGPVPNVDSYHDMLSELNIVQSISDIKHPTNQALKKKLDELHDKISTFIKKIDVERKRTRNQKLIATYQSAYDFLEDIQHEMDNFDEHIAENDNKLNVMESKIHSAQQKYKSLMIKFKNSKAAEKELRETNINLNNQITDLSMRMSEIKLQKMMAIPSNEDDGDDDIEEEEKKTMQFQSSRMKMEYNLSSFDKKQKVISASPPKPSKASKPSKPSKSKRKTIKKVIAKKKEKKKLKTKPKPKWKQKSEIDENNHPYLYDEFKHDNGNQCVSEFFTVFSQEIGFIACNRYG